MSEVKQCNYCGESILAVAIKCKHCGSSLDNNTTDSKGDSLVTDYGLFLLLVPVVSTMLIWFWISGMNLTQAPSSKMDLIIVSTVLITAIIAAIEAKKNGMVSNRSKGTYSPIAWFFIITLLWIVGYPVYLYKRRHFGLKNLLALGLFVALAFLGSWSIMQASIQSAQTEAENYLNQAQYETENFG